ncbi:PdaC/SigV domain-containing protein [Lederbergia wuyishanensis]|uniref:Deacetylase PdaC domain-containing protein n=1 Tax=Lederbergia wuyishanensis TaxID=1347903 RepID=A0ABU0D7R6_9BACI|nr:DUF4163 domain-containing protein [Lederbergia wuyishanensis]MCJ8009098.1 DUF3298 and DUF4163 domain-containing protein [Lederbergia wuyishanensis]MDQ0344435.1 hypothetical protein [Lederbergia wuyishanensis]
MKQLRIIFSLFLLLFLLVGCNKKDTSAPPTKAEKESSVSEMENNQEELRKKLTNYESITLEEKNEEHEVTIEYPKFSYEPLDDILSSQMDASFQLQTSDDNEALFEYDMEGIQYIFTTSFKKPVITQDYVSIYFEDYQYWGGAHGMSSPHSFNFDLKNDRIMTIHDVMKEHSTTLQVMSEMVAQKLINDEGFAEYREEPVTADYRQSVKSETIPVEENFSTFTLSEDGITFYKQYFSLFPNAMGIVGIDLKWLDVDNYMTSEKEEASNTNDSFTYQNDDYNFVLTLPSSWEGKYVVSKGDWNMDAEVSYDFNFVHNGEVICNLFSINILNEDVVGEDPELGMMTYIDRKNSNIYTYSTIPEMPEEFMEGGKLENLQDMLVKMVNDDVPNIIETFDFK